MLYANCENRLSVSSPANVIEIRTPATDILNGLYRFKSLFRGLHLHILARFSYHLLILEHNLPQLELGTALNKPPDESDSPDKNDYYRKVEEWKRNHFTRIQDSGHGLRSMVRVLEALLNQKAPVKRA